VDTIPALVTLAVWGYPSEREKALDSLAGIDPNWSRHPNSKEAVPRLVKLFSPERIEMQFEGERDHVDKLARAEEMLIRLGPGAREAIPALLVARATVLRDGLRMTHRDDVVKAVEILKRLPGAIDAAWPNSPEAVVAIPALVKLLEKNPGPAAELLGRFGPAARCALPALRETRDRLERTRHPKAEAVDQAMKLIEATMGGRSEVKPR
jgi:hypothetical protein